MRWEQAIAQQDWAHLGAQLDQQGHAMLPGLLDTGQVRALAALCEGPGTTTHRFTPTSKASQVSAQGLLFQAATVLPPGVAALQSALYPHLAPIANRWNAALGRPHRHTEASGALRGSCLHLSRLQAGEQQPLHHHGDGAQDFALQLVALLSAPDEDFSGGAFVMTEQRPRMQSRPIVLPLRQGDVAVIAVAQRPHVGTKGIYAVRLRHAVGRVRRGERLGLEWLFDAA